MTGTALSRTVPAVPDQKEWHHIERVATMVARSSMCPKAFKNKPEDLMVVALSLRDSDVPFTLNTLNQCYVIDGRMEMMAQLKVAIAARHGWDLWFDPDECDDTRAVVHYQAPGRPERTMVYTADEARAAHLLDEWVEHQVADGKWPDGNTKYRKQRFTVSVDGEPVDTPQGQWPEWARKAHAEGLVYRKDPWFANRGAMNMARAVTKALRYAAPHLTLGIGDSDTDVADDEPPEVAMPAPLEVLRPYLDQLSQEQLEQLGAWRQANGLPSPSEMTPEQVARVLVQIGTLLGMAQARADILWSMGAETDTTPDVVTPELVDQPGLLDDGRPFE
jgi:hypothetical protein